jgi:hypothetical protein
MRLTEETVYARLKRRTLRGIGSLRMLSYEECVRVGEVTEGGHAFSLCSADDR